MVRRPARAAPVLWATLNATVPASTPALPDVTVMKASLLTACHAQPVAWDATVTLPVPPFDPKPNAVWLSGEDADHALQHDVDACVGGDGRRRCASSGS